jgi:energy-coupling factor transport system permease protein
VLTSVEGSIQLAESMEARGFGSGPRTSLQAAHLGRNDWILVATSAAAVIAFIAGRASDWYPYPTLHAPQLDIVPLAACLLLFTPVLTWRSRA